MDDGTEASNSIVDMATDQTTYYVND